MKGVCVFLWPVLLFLCTCFSSISFSQDDYFSKRLVKEKWTVSFLAYESTSNHDGRSIGDTVILSKKKPGLDERLHRPYKFKRNGKVKQLSLKPFSCGTITKIESLWALQWREKGKWTISTDENTVYLHFDWLKLRPIRVKSKDLYFVICE